MNAILSSNIEMRTNRKFAISPTCRHTLIGIGFLVLTACGGGSGDSNLFKENGIDTGSVSSNFQIDASNIPALGAAMSADIEDDYLASKFLQRATFGATPASIIDLRDVGYVGWIRNQMQMPATFMLDVTRKQNPPRWAEHVNSWLNIASTADDQLRQRVAYALSQFFVVSDQGGLGEQQAALSNYYDILIANSFGNFRELMELVTLSPIMGDYLSMKGNQKPDPQNGIRPDENYARELLQLFSIGLVQMDSDGRVRLDEDGVPEPTYDQQVIEGFAHVFTGWHFNNVDEWNYPKVEDWYTPMAAYQEHHDSSEKTLLNNVVLPAGQSAQKDLQDALDNIFNHNNVAPFFAKHMIKQLVTSNPSSAYIQRVANAFEDDGNGVRGNIGAVVIATLLDTEALAGYELAPETFGKLREPVIRLVSLWRAFDANTNTPQFSYSWIKNRLNQAPLQSPSVFNFFSPEFSQAGEIRNQMLNSPEFQIHNESSIIDITSALLAHSIWHNTESGSEPQFAPVDITQLMLLDDDRNAQYKLLSTLLIGRPASDALREQADYLLDARKNASSEIRAEELLFLFATSPEAAVQR